MRCLLMRSGVNEWRLSRTSASCRRRALASPPGGGSVQDERECERRSKTRESQSSFLTVLMSASWERSSPSALR